MRHVRSCDVERTCFPMGWNTTRLIYQQPELGNVPRVQHLRSREIHIVEKIHIKSSADTRNNSYKMALLRKLAKSVTRSSCPSICFSGTWIRAVVCDEINVISRQRMCIYLHCEASKISQYYAMTSLHVCFAYNREE